MKFLNSISIFGGVIGAILPIMALWDVFVFGWQTDRKMWR
jgi:hypothetical protein